MSPSQFAVALQRPPVHSRDPTLRPVEVLPLLPDFEAWTNKYVTVHYDNDPTQEVDMLKRLEPRKRKKVAGKFGWQGCSGLLGYNG